MASITCFLLLLLGAATFAKDKPYHNPHYFPNRAGMIQLFEWPFSAIADECEKFLGPKGYAGVQVSPVSENVVIEGRPWYERYQPISYDIKTRLGNTFEFIDMAKRCNNAGVRVYVDVLLNHMSANQDTFVAKGVGGTMAIPSLRLYPGVPYTKSHFNTECQIVNYGDKTEARDCELVGLHDLDLSEAYVQMKHIQFLNKLIDYGVAGFRIDAASHMWPNHLKSVYTQLKNLPTKFNFEPNSRPFIYQEATMYVDDYTDLGRILEFKYSYFLTNAARGVYPIANYEDIGTKWGLVSSDNAIVFMDNHDTQRTYDPITYKEPVPYVIGTAYMLAYPYGLPRVMSSYEFTDFEQGPPQNSREQIIKPRFDRNGQCNNGWVCEHRWEPIANMIGFAIAVQGTDVGSFTSNDQGQISFCRGKKGFIVFNTGTKNMKTVSNTCLPSGVYCDVISGSFSRGKCTGKEVIVDGNGKANIAIPANDRFKVIAIHVNSKKSK